MIFYATSAIEKKENLVKISYTLEQSAILGYLISIFYKAFTGRVEPPEIFSSSSSTIDISHVFRFGFWRGGIFWGWPSSHTTVAFAMAVALIAMYPKSKPIRYLAAFYAFYVGLGVSMTIHWFSDFAAGAIIGTVIGMVVGKSFRSNSSV